MNKPPIVVREDLPEAVRALALRRTAALLTHYGHCIRDISLETLVVSCYLQGVEDAAAAQARAATASPPPR